MNLSQSLWDFPLLEALEATLYEDRGFLNLGVSKININLLFIDCCWYWLWYRRWSIGIAWRQLILSHCFNDLLCVCVLLQHRRQQIKVSKTSEQLRVKTDLQQSSKVSTSLALIATTLQTKVEILLDKIVYLLIHSLSYLFKYGWIERLQQREEQLSFSFNNCLHTLWCTNVG